MKNRPEIWPTVHPTSLKIVEFSFESHLKQILCKKEKQNNRSLENLALRVLCCSKRNEMAVTCHHVQKKASEIQEENMENRWGHQICLI